MPRFETPAALGLAAMLLLVPPEALAQRAPSAEATVQGRVTEVETGEPLPGANVVVDGSAIGTATDPDGRFVLRGVPVGAQTLRVTFIGYEPVVRAIEVAPGRQVVDVALAPVTVAGREVVVEAVARGQARALNQQRTAATIVNVISHEQLEGFADETVTEALRRLPGATADHDRGEPDGFRLRGLGPALHTVTVDGRRMASTGLNTRATDLSGVPADLVSSIEVTKAFTPDMHGESTSGSVNIVTRRPVGTERILQGRLAGGYNQLAGAFGTFADAANYRAALTYGERSPRFAYVLNASLRRDGRFQEDIRHQWAYSPAVDRPVLAILEPSVYPIRRNMLSLAGTVDLYTSEVTTLLARAAYHRRVDGQERHQFTMDIARGTFRPDNTTTGGRGRIDVSARTYTNTRDQVNATLGAEHAWSHLQLDYALSYAFGRETRDPVFSYEFRASGFDFAVDDSTPRYSSARVIAGDPLDPARYAFRRFQWERLDGRDHDASASLNAELPFRLGAHGGRFKTGLHGSWRVVEGSRERERFERVTEPVMLSDLGMTAYSGILGGYSIPLAVDWRGGEAFFRNHRARFVLDEDYSRAYSTENTYEGGEAVGAAYAMATVEFGPLMVLAGARLEATRQDYTGLRTRIDAGGRFLGAERVSGGRTFANLLPALHLRYALDARTNLRFALTQTMARAPFRLIAPTRIENLDAQRLELGNPKLLPERFTNLDLLAEHYFRGGGAVSAGVFFKYAQDVITNQSRLVQGGDFDGFVEIQPVNADDAYVAGVELAWQQQLLFLPGALRGLGVFANYTYTWTAADYGRDRRYPLLGTTPHVANAALAYRLGGFSSQLSLSYQSTTFYDTATRLPAELIERAAFAYADRYRRIGTSLDLAVSQRIGPITEAFLEVNNLLNSPNFDYYGDPRFPYRENAHSWFANVGVRLNL